MRKYNTLEELIEAMQRLVNRNVKYYKTDFNYDKAAIKKNTGETYLWITRNSGTWLLKLSDPDFAKYMLDSCFDNYGNKFKVYFVDTKKLSIKKITFDEAYKVVKAA